MNEAKADTHAGIVRGDRDRHPLGEEHRLAALHFALLGDDPQGIELALELAASPARMLAYYSGDGSGHAALTQRGLHPRVSGDIEEVLADPRVEWVIVATSPTTRAAVAKRVMQAEKRLICVHPLDARPDPAFEVAQIERETGRPALTTLTHGAHPAVQALGAFVEQMRNGGRDSRPFLVQMEISADEAFWFDRQAEGKMLRFPYWQMLRSIGGDLGDVTIVAAPGDNYDREPLVMAGSFAQGGMWQVVCLPGCPNDSLRVRLQGSAQSPELVFVLGWPGEARLTWIDDDGKPQQQRWESWNPWQAVVAAVAGDAGARAALCWEVEIRNLEIASAAQQSLDRRRTVVLEYLDDSEEASFKGAMTLTGCAILWLSLLLLIASIVVPYLGYLILPLLAIFLALQVMHRFVNRGDNSGNDNRAVGASARESTAEARKPR